MGESGDAAGARVRSTAARRAALEERSERLRTGTPASSADVLRARAWAAAQVEESEKAWERLRATHAMAAERSYAAAAVIEAAGRPERAADLRAAARRHEEAAHLSEEVQANHERGAAAMNPAVDSLLHVFDGILDNDPATLTFPTSPAIQRMAAANRRLRALIAALGATHSATAGQNEDRRRSLWDALAERCGGDNWRGWCQAACEVGTSWLPVVDGTVISLHDDHGASPLGAWDSWAESLEELQVVMGEGPSLTAHRSGVLVIVSDLAAERHRWPGYASAAARTGLNSVWAFPLQVANTNLGVVTFYRRTAGMPTTRDLWDATAVVELAAAAVIGDADEMHQAGALPDRSPFAAVHIATGIVATRLSITTDEAMVRLRAHAFGSGHRLRTVAELVIQGIIPAL